MLLFISFLIILSVISMKISTRLGLPLLIGFILIGIIVGSDVLNWFYFDNALLTKQIAEILLIFIIFDGGFRIPRDIFRKVAGPSLTLATLGVVLTATFLGLCIHFLLGFELAYAFLIASIISSTDAAAVFMITNANPIKHKLAATLNVESAANDPMAIMLTITFIQVVTKAFSSPFTAIMMLLWQFVGGALLGFICYKISVFFLNSIKSESRGSYHVLMVGCILLTYGLADVLKANGIIAVFFLGFLLGNHRFPAKQSVSSFLESVSTIFNIGLFIMLGLLAFPHRFVFIWKEALIIVGILMFIARPLAVFLSMLPFKYTHKEKLFITWGGIKGAVPIVLATYPLASGIDTNGFIFDTIFFAVFLSCIVQGTTLAPLAKFFRFTEQKKSPVPHVIELHSLQLSDYEMVEVSVEADSPHVKHSISELHLDTSMLITSIVRHGRLIIPKGNTSLLANDTLYVLTPSSKINDVNTYINGDITTT
jgi:cell volume regulation protein A